MTEIATESTLQPPRFREAFLRLLPELRAIPESAYITINIDVPSTVTTVLGAWNEIRLLRDQIVRDVPSFEVRFFDSLESRALALGHAQTAYQTATEPSASLVAQADKATKCREILLGEVNTLIARGLIAPSALKELKGVNGYKNIAFDLFALANILDKNWSKVSDRTGVKRDEVDQAQVIADNLVTAVGEREQAPLVAAEAVRDRQAAFTYFIEAYDEVRSVIAYTRRKQGDADSIAPSLYAGRVSTKKKPVDGESEQPPPTTPSTDLAHASGTAVAPATNAGAPQVRSAEVTAAGPYV